MIDIEKAIEKSKNMENTSAGGSDCFDFGDVVLVKYSCLTKYLKNGERSREKSEEIMDVINKKNEDGVNTPKHLSVKRIIEGENDICYVLQEKCPGYNCATKSKYGVSFDEMYESLKSVFNIPFEHYRKLIEDGCKLFEMGYEAKSKNLFYDKESGFWYIDFLDNHKDYMFDPNNIKKVFEAISYRIPKPFQIISTVCYDEKLTSEQSKKKKELEFGIKAKTLLAIKSVLPNFEKYEKFFLFNEENDYKKYLMREAIVNKDLMILETIDYEIYNELYEIVMEGIIDKITNKGEKFWSIECNDIKNDSNLFKLQTFFEKSKYNSIKLEDFESKYDYKYEVSSLFVNSFLNDLLNRLKQMKKNENIISFLYDAEIKQKQSNNINCYK